MPSPGHNVRQMEHLLQATNAVFTELGIKRTSEWQALAATDTMRMAVVISLQLRFLRSGVCIWLSLASA